MEPTGVPARELSDAELERQGTHAHATRNWVFLHGTAEQFAHHTERMLELEKEYLRRHPKRTWQGSATDGGEVDEATRRRTALRGLVTQIESVLAEAEPLPGAASGAVAGRPGRPTPRRAPRRCSERSRTPPAAGCTGSSSTRPPAARACPGRTSRSSTAASRRCSPPTAPTGCSPTRAGSGSRTVHDPACAVLWRVTHPKK